MRLESTDWSQLTGLNNEDGVREDRSFKYIGNTGLETPE